MAATGVSRDLVNYLVTHEKGLCLQFLLRLDQTARAKFSLAKIGAHYSFVSVYKPHDKSSAEL